MGYDRIWPSLDIESNLKSGIVRGGRSFISSYIEPILCSQIAVHLSFFHHGEMMEDMTYDACKMLV